MILLESAEALHNHIDECHYCTCGAREGIMCFVGRLLLEAVQGETALLRSRATIYDRALAEKKNVAGDAFDALHLAMEADRIEARPRTRKAGSNGVAGAGEKLRERLGTQSDTEASLS